jgi:Ca2+:H+ antiporter
MNLDSVKSRARHASWKRDDDSVWDQINPFGRTNSRSSALSKSNSRDLEAGAGEFRPKPAKQPYSEPDIHTSVNTYSAPQRANTTGSPTDSITTQGTAAEYYQSPNINTSNATTLNGDVEKAGLSKRGLAKVPEDEAKFSTDQDSGNSAVTREDEDEKKERLKREHDERMKAPIPIIQQIKTVLFPQWLTINWLLFAAPVGIGLHFTGVDPLIIFIVNFVAIVPLAGILSFATEEIAIRVGEVLGGLLNASFG